MTQTVGYYILLGVIGLFAVGSLVLIIMVVLTNRREAKSKTEQLAQPQQASVLRICAPPNTPDTLKKTPGD